MGNAELDAALLAAYLGRLGLPSALELPPTVETLRALPAEARSRRVLDARRTRMTQLQKHVKALTTAVYAVLAQRGPLLVREQDEPASRKVRAKPAEIRPKVRESDGLSQTL